MKYLVAIALFAALCAVARSEEEEVCYSKVTSACSGDTLSASSHVCDSRYGGIANVEREVKAYMNSELTKSYEYLLLATYFNSYQKNRPGFQKLYQELSDRSFDNTIDLIKQLTRRGGRVDFNLIHESPASVAKQQINLEVNELHSLALALDNEKKLSNGAIHVHRHASMHENRDPEMAQYLEEKFLTKQADSVRKLSGYANDLSKMLNQKDPSLAIYLFDEYLQKQ